MSLQPRFHVYGAYAYCCRQKREALPSLVADCSHNHHDSRLSALPTLPLGRFCPSTWVINVRRSGGEDYPKSAAAHDGPQVWGLNRKIALKPSALACFGNLDGLA